MFILPRDVHIPNLYTVEEKSAFNRTKQNGFRVCIYWEGSKGLLYLLKGFILRWFGYIASICLISMMLLIKTETNILLTLTISLL